MSIPDPHSHKIFGPTGSGVLYGKERLLEELPPYQGGGDMVDQVRFEGTTYNDLPFKFEAGTMNYTGAIGLATALEYLQGIGFEAIGSYEKELIDYSLEKLSSIPGLKLFGEAARRISVFSFLLDKIHSYDAGMILDKMGMRFTGVMAASIMVVGASLKFWAVSTHTLDGVMWHILWFDTKAQVFLAALGFAIFGVGVEVAGITVSKIIVRWFKGKELALAMGLQVAVARLGTALALGVSSPIALGLGAAWLSRAWC